MGTKIKVQPLQTVDTSAQVPTPLLPTIDPDGTKSVTGRSTIFGLNYNGTIDTGDNGQGYFGYNTRDKSLIGVSLPIPVIDETIGNHRNTDVIHVIKEKKFMVYVVHHDKSITAPIVDIGPSVWTGNAIDLTFAAVKALGITDNSTVTYQIMDSDGEPMVIKGWHA